MVEQIYRGEPLLTTTISFITIKGVKNRIGKILMPYADTLQIYDVLRKEFDEGKAKAIAASIETALESNNGILLEKVATKEDIANLRAEMVAQIAGLETKTAAQIASLKVEMAAQKAEIIRMNFLFWLGLIPVMAALIKFIR